MLQAGLSGCRAALCSWPTTRRTSAPWQMPMPLRDGMAMAIGVPVYLSERAAHAHALECTVKRPPPKLRPRNPRSALKIRIDNSDRHAKQWRLRSPPSRCASATPKARPTKRPMGLPRLFRDARRCAMGNGHSRPGGHSHAPVRRKPWPGLRPVRVLQCTLPPCASFPR